MSCCSVALRSLVVYAVSILLLSAVSSQVCTAPDTVGSLNHDEITIEANRVYILTGYTVQCEGIVTTWEFCYQRLDTAPSVAFYPGIWMETINNGGNSMFSLIQSNRATFDPRDGSMFSCQNYTVPVAEQFTAPSGSIVGLFSNDFVKLLHTNANDSGITTYRVVGIQDSVNGGTDVNFNIAIRVHLSPNTTTASFTSTSVMPTTSTSVIATTSTPVMATTSTSVIATTSIPVMATTSTPVMATTSTPDMATTSTPVMATTLTPDVATTSTFVMATTSISVMATTSISVMATTSTPVMSTTSTSVMATTSTPVMATTSTPVMSTMSTSVMAITSTPVMSTTSTPVMATTSTPDMATSSTPDMANTSTITVATTTTNTVTEGDADSSSGSSSSSGSIGIIAGCVVGVIICIIILLLIIILLWYRRQKKGKLTIPPETFQLQNCGKDCEEITENTNQYSTIKNQYSVIKHVDNGSAVYKNTQPDYDVPSDPDYCSSSVNNKPAKSSYYSDPVDTLTRDRPKLASNDYETVRNHNDYSSAQRTYSNILHDPLEYSNVSGSALSYSTAFDDTTTSASMSVGDEEECFADPGHSEEAIYACFESKRFRSISANTVSMLQKLGSGEFGVVHLGTWTDGSADPIQVAVKTLNSECSESDRVKFLREAAIMGQFKNNHIVELYGVVTEKEKTMIVLEYMLKGDLREFLIELKNTTPPETCGELKHDLLSFCRQISSGLSYLANKQFVHRDLAARNILVSSDDVCKIADFGMARDVSDDTYYMSTGGKIPVKWTAPEAIFYKKYSTQSDVWSFGCVMYEIWSLGHKPFEDYDGREYVNKIITGYRLPPPPGCPKSIYKLMIQCWNPVPNKRIDPSELSRTLQKSDRTLLPRTMAPNDSEELSSTLGASLDTSSHIYADLQNAYLPE